MDFLLLLVLATIMYTLPVHSARAPVDTFLFQGRDNTPFIQNSKANFLQGGYLVEYHDNAKQFSAFSTALGGAGFPAKHRFDFNHKYFRGSSFVINDNGDQQSAMAKIMATNQVKNVWPLRLIQRDPGQLHSKLPPGAKLRSSKLPKRESGKAWSTHAMTGVDKLHAKGMTGKGMFVAILDTGVDYKHPDLGGGFGPGFKVAKGYDFVGDNAIIGRPQPDADPYDSCGFHGTWVSGIVAANPGALNAPGVAPDATLGMYRIFDCFLWTSEDIVISAYLKAYDDGADVISLSFGSYSGVHNGKFSYPLGRVVSSIVDSGVVCIAVSGEVGGPPFQANSPASALGVISVATVENSVKPMFHFIGNYSVVNGKSEAFEYEPTNLPLTQRRSLWTWNYTMDFQDPYSLTNCPEFPEEIPDLKEHVALVPFCLATMLSAVGLGVKHIMLHDRGEIFPSVAAKKDNDAKAILGLGIVNRQQGDEWQRNFLSGMKATLTFTDPNKPEFRYRETPNKVGGLVDIWSSWGPTLELDSTPIVAAPGTNVLSTLPKREGIYGVLSHAGGAAPYAAGVAALLKQNNKKIDPKYIIRALTTTANLLNFSNGQSTDNTLAPPIQQGGGLINAFSAVHSETLLSPSHIKIKGRYDDTALITLRNTGRQAKWYSISHKPSHSVYTVFSNLLERGTLPELEAASARVLTFPPRIKVPARTTLGFIAYFILPRNLANQRVPIYSGHILVKEDDGPEFSVSYLGSPSDLKTIECFNNRSTYLATTDDISKKAAPGRTFKFPRNNITDIEDFDLPIMMVGLDFYTREIVAEIIPEKPIEGFNGKLGGNEPFGPFPPGIIIPIPVFGNLASGDFAPEGKFKMSVKALRYHGEQGKNNDWNVFKSSSFSIEYVGGTNMTANQ
ncbi:hypothetical protein LOZ12_001637 [Ophidiomyces ophidiicola]|nr:hypothetical protein LOZ62_001858 [Ophidiomyces ophidiicola]KAI1965462.1 hypothetical protein LOZ59_001273 [Ophidiomyces ophidiicola]KAI1973936.1 hypothetical protein LOZ56_001551 [Ophidiomyces ophidiicola]KAI2008160.1 hypothetical protein LOZ50_002158 [Ophidiomyces ophidiicola]KAI2027992.1 hypothetical protein LOZ45_002388 [Ophidiomyces ophidiicola]